MRNGFEKSYRYLFSRNESSAHIINILLSLRSSLIPGPTSICSELQGC